MCAHTWGHTQTLPNYESWSNIAPSSPLTDISYANSQSSGSVQRIETPLHESGGGCFLCSLSRLVWEQHTKSPLHNASHRSLELPCGSVPVSPLPRLFKLQSQLAPPFCLLWPGVNKQTMTRWAGGRLCHSLPHQLSWRQKAKGGYTIRRMLYNNTERYIVAVDKKSLKLLYKLVQLMANKSGFKSIQSTQTVVVHMFSAS